MEDSLRNNHLEIYQFTILLIFLVALIFFVYMYWYSIRLKKSLLLEEEAKRKLLTHKLKLQKTEMEKQKLEAEQKVRQEQTLRLEQEVVLKNKKLTATTLLVNQHNEVLNELKQQLESVRGVESQIAVKQARQLIRNNLSISNEWSQFKTHFETVHPDFFKTLSQRYPSLSQNDLRHCAYIRMQMSTKEIARMFNIAPTSVQISRVRMKKKMNLDRNKDLRKHILEI